MAMEFNKYLVSLGRLANETSIVSNKTFRALSDDENIYATLKIDSVSDFLVGTLKGYFKCPDHIDLIEDTVYAPEFSEEALEEVLTELSQYLIYQPTAEEQVKTYKKFIHMVGQFQSEFLKSLGITRRDYMENSIYDTLQNKAFKYIWGRKGLSTK